MLRYYDYHTHSTISFDSHISIEETCSLAVAVGAAGLTFTEHVELYSGKTPDALPDFAAYAAQIKAARIAFPQLALGMGLEVDLNPARRSEIEQILAGNWDFVLGALHELNGLSTYNGEFSRGKSKEQTYHDYFAGLYEQVKRMDCFDVLAHLDVIRRDATIGDVSLNYAAYADLIEPLLSLLIERGQGLEVNTAGWRYKMADAHPGLTVLRRYRQLGGEIITCGSDCHHPSRAFYRIREGYELIKQAGFKYISLFEGRKLRQMKLE
ncbi:MAG: histidinol-phosphatase HisJ family protein [Clostridiales bacterium]|nr:histidinol-phosphatase HisJ family protein [Clostridiales bacterium]